jgi:hypothetical protein
MHAARTRNRSLAAEYYEAVTGIKLKAIDHLRLPDGVLEWAARGYANVRHGVDADTGLVRVGLGFLCSGAIEYIEEVTGGNPKNRPVDPYLQLTNGA